MRASFVVFNALDRHAMRSNSISFIGLGRMGSQMAFNLFWKKFNENSTSRFVVCDFVPASATAFQQNFLSRCPGAHLEIVETPAEAVLASQTVVTMLPSSPQVRSVYSEDRGIIPALKSLPVNHSENTLCIDSTTLDVNVAREVAMHTVQAGAQMVDAPVSGGVPGAAAGTLSFLVGGTEPAFHLAEPFLACMGKRIIHCGPAGAGLAAKICNNLILGVQQIVVAEAMLLGQNLGLDSAVLASVINSSTGACWASSVNNPVPSALPEKSPPCERDYEGGFATALMLKDMGLATDIAETTGSLVPLGDAAKAMYALQVQDRPDLATKDFSSIYLYLRQVASEGKILSPVETK